MRQIIAELHVYVLADGHKRRVYRTERKTKKETSYFYIDRDGKAQYLTELEVMGFPASWMTSIPVRNN